MGGVLGGMSSWGCFTYVSYGGGRCTCGASHAYAGSSRPQCGAMRLQGGREALVLKLDSSWMTHSFDFGSNWYAAQ